MLCSSPFRLTVLAVKSVDCNKVPEDALGGGGGHNMLEVRVCAAHMGGFLGTVAF